MLMSTSPVVASQIHQCPREPYNQVHTKKHAWKTAQHEVPFLLLGIRNTKFIHEGQQSNY